MSLNPGIFKNIALQGFIKYSGHGDKHPTDQSSEPGASRWLKIEQSRLLQKLPAGASPTLKLCSCTKTTNISMRQKMSRRYYREPIANLYSAPSRNPATKPLVNAGDSAFSNLHLGQQGHLPHLYMTYTTSLQALEFFWQQIGPLENWL